jgi:hypothetical protein
MARREPETREVLGVITEGPSVMAGATTPMVHVFRLNSRPELEFRQVVSPLSASRRRGDRVRVRYWVNPDGTATVDRIEKA